MPSGNVNRLPAVPGRLVDAGSPLEQELDDRNVPVPAGAVHWRQALACGDVHVCEVIEENLRHLCVAVPAGAVQRCPAVLHDVIQQQHHGLLEPAPGSREQRRAAVVRNSHGGMTLLTRSVQGRVHPAFLTTSTAA